MRTDFYTLVHKLVRARLFDLVTQAGRTDAADPAARASLVDALDRGLAWLDAHAHHEDTFIGPLLRRVAPEEAATAEAEHAALATAEQALRDAARSGADVYVPLTRFATRYLAHLDHEETVLQPALWARCTEAELAAAMAAFRASRSPAQGQADVVAMYPWLAPPERARMLDGMRAAMPADAFASFAEALSTATGA